MPQAKPSPRSQLSADALLEFVTNPEKYQQKLRELEARKAAAEAAEAHLEVREKAFQLRAVDIDQLNAACVKRENAVAARERKVAKGEAEVAKARAFRDFAGATLADMAEADRQRDEGASVS